MTECLHLLSGVRVLDLTKATSGPFATQILGDLGADVIKVEAPPSDLLARDVLDAVNRIEDMDAFFMCVNRNKRSLVVRLTDPEGLSLIHELVRHVDVVIDNFRPGVTSKLRVDHETLKAINPRIITCSLSGYGASGPLRNRAGFDITVQAQTGMTAFNDLRDEDGRLEAVRAPIADLVGGMYCSIAIPAALHHRTTTGSGCHIDVAMYDSVLTWFAGFGVHLLNFGYESNISKSVLWGSFDTMDRPLVITAHRTSQFIRFCKALDRMEWLTDERFAAPKERAENLDELKGLIDTVLRTRTAKEWIERFEAEGLSYAETLTIEEALHHPHTTARDMVVDVSTRRGASMKLIGNPIKVDGVEQRFTPPPLVGEDTADILRDLLQRSDLDIAALQAKGTIYGRER